MPDCRWNWTKSEPIWEQGIANWIMSQVSTGQENRQDASSHTFIKFNKMQGFSDG